MNDNTIPVCIHKVPLKPVKEDDMCLWKCKVCGLTITSCPEWEVASVRFLRRRARRTSRTADEMSARIEAAQAELTNRLAEPAVYSPFLLGETIRNSATPPGPEAIPTLENPRYIWSNSTTTRIPESRGERAARTATQVAEEQSELMGRTRIVRVPTSRSRQ